MPLLVYLHDDNVVETNIFCSETLSNSLIASTIEANFLLWGWDISTLNGRGILQEQCRELSTYAHFSFCFVSKKKKKKRK